MENYNLEAEQAILGGLIFNNENYYNIQDIIIPTMFYHEVHANIYKTIETLINTSKIADLVSITEELRGAEWFIELGGNEFLKLLDEKTSRIINIKTYSKIVAECYKRRQCVLLTTGAIQSLVNEDKSNTDSVINDLTTNLMDLTDNSKGNQGFKELSESDSIFEQAMKAYERKDPITGIQTNYSRLDNLTGGLKGGKLIILAARPAMGKSAFAFNIAQNVADNYLEDNKGAKVGIFSLEMGRDEIKTRLISGVSAVNQDIITKGLFENNNQIQKVKQAEHRVNKLPITIDETPALHINQIRARAIKLKRKYGIGLLVIDYLQLCKGNNQNRTLEIGEISMGLKQIAKELDIPVIALAQLNRGLESRPNKRPILSDLRDSGSIEQDADMIMFLHREAYYYDKTLSTDKSSKEYAEGIKALVEYTGLTELIISKNRGGQCENIKMLFDGATTTFIDISDLSLNIGVEKDNMATVFKYLESLFEREDWYNSKFFYNHFRIFLDYMKKVDKNNINRLLFDTIDKIPALKGCSPVVLGAVASAKGFIQ